MPSTEHARLDRAATGPNPRARVPVPLPGQRCRRCHRIAGDRAWGVPCALCSPVMPTEVLQRAVRGELVIEFR